MSKINPVYQAASILSVFLCSSLNPAFAAKSLEHSSTSKKSTEELSVSSAESAVYTKESFSELNRDVSYLISQTTDSQTLEDAEIIEDSQVSEEAEPSEIDQLNPSVDKLELPDTPEEVDIDITQPITLEQAVELAIRNNTDLQEARLNVRRSRRELQQARAALYPTLDLSSDLINSDTASNNRSAERFGDTTADDQVGDSTTSFSGNLTLTYDIYEGGRRGADIRRAKKQLEFSELDLERLIEQTIFEAKRDYYSLQDADSQVEIEQAAVEDATQTLRDARLLQEAGLGTRFDVLRAEVELANAVQRLTSAKATQEIASRQLVETLSLGQRVDLQTADEIEKAGEWDLALEESIVAAYDNRAELDQFLVNREINQAQKQIALANIRPQLSIFGQVDFLEVSDDDTDITTGYTVGAQLRWAIFDGGVAKAIARQEEVDVELAENGFANQRDQVRLEVEQAFYSLEANEDNIDTALKAVELAEESLRLARLRFQAGVGTQTDVIEAQTELTTARGNLLTAVIQYNQSLNELRRAITGVSDASPSPSP